MLSYPVFPELECWESVQTHKCLCRYEYRTIRSKSGQEMSPWAGSAWIVVLLRKPQLAFCTGSGTLISLSLFFFFLQKMEISSKSNWWQGKVFPEQTAHAVEQSQVRLDGAASAVGGCFVLPRLVCAYMMGFLGDIQYVHGISLLTGRGEPIARALRYMFLSCLVSIQERNKWLCVIMLYHDHITQMLGRLPAFCCLLTESQQDLIGFCLFFTIDAVYLFSTFRVTWESKSNSLPTITGSLCPLTTPLISSLFCFTPYLCIPLFCFTTGDCCRVLGSFTSVVNVSMKNRWLWTQKECSYLFSVWVSKQGLSKSYTLEAYPFEHELKSLLNFYICFLLFCPYCLSFM